MSTAPVGPQPGYQPQVCAFHPDRPTALHCTRCGRPACPDCLTPASVGFHCRACVAESRATQRAPVTVAGGAVGGRPVATFALIAVNVVVYVLSVAQSRSLDDPQNSTVFRDGALVPDLVGAGQVWRLVTSGFLHLSVLHIASNMLSLYFLGLPTERVLGRARFLTVYGLALLGGSVTVLLFAGGDSLSAGASGAIFGLMGALFVTFRRLKLDSRQLIGVLALNLVITFGVSGISWQAHLGGLVVGAAAGALMVYPRREVRARVQLLGSLGLLVLLIVITVVFMATHTSTYCNLVGDYLLHC